jgi:hypothetical protein
MRKFFGSEPQTFEGVPERGLGIWFKKVAFSKETLEGNYILE